MRKREQKKEYSVANRAVGIITERVRESNRMVRDGIRKQRDNIRVLRDNIRKYPSKPALTVTLRILPIPLLSLKSQKELFFGTLYR